MATGPALYFVRPGELDGEVCARAVREFAQAMRHGTHVHEPAFFHEREVGRGVGHIDAIYVSDARQNQQTAAPLAERLGKQAVVVPARDAKALASRVMHEHTGGSVLVIGQSASVPELLHELGDVDVPPLTDDEYDTLYVLSIPSFGHTSVLRMEF